MFIEVPCTSKFLVCTLDIYFHNSVLRNTAQQTTVAEGLIESLVGNDRCKPTISYVTVSPIITWSRWYTYILLTKITGCKMKSRLVILERAGYSFWQLFCGNYDNMVDGGICIITWYGTVRGNDTIISGSVTNYLAVSLWIWFEQPDR